MVQGQWTYKVYFIFSFMSLNIRQMEKKYIYIKYKLWTLTRPVPPCHIISKKFHF